MQDNRRVAPYLYAEERLRHGCFYCDICGRRWPLTHRVTQSAMNGKELRVGRLCCYEPRGTEIDRNVREAVAAELAARLTKKEVTKPLYGPDNQFYPGTVEWSENDPQQVWIESITPRPVVLSRGGAAVPVVVAGGGFTATDTFSYGASGITDDSAPSRASSSEWDLSVKASASMTPGRYSLTLNSLTMWSEVFDVR